MFLEIVWHPQFCHWKHLYMYNCHFYKSIFNLVNRFNQEKVIPFHSWSRNLLCGYPSSPINWWLHQLIHVTFWKHFLVCKLHASHMSNLPTSIIASFNQQLSLIQYVYFVACFILLIFFSYIFIKFTKNKI